MPSIKMIQFEDVHFSRGSNVIFSGVDLNIKPGLITAIMGPSGTGKTTLLRMIGGQVHPDRGVVRVDGNDMAALRGKPLYHLRRRMGMLFQAGALFTDVNVFENVAFPLREHTDLSEDMIRDLVLMMLEAVGLRGAAHLNIHELSGGMKHRVAIARAIVLGPELMMYDEPFTGQDPIGRGVLLKLIRQLNDTFGLTSIVVSHDVNETAAIADYLFIIADGKIIGEGTPQTVLQDKSPLIHQFINGLPDGAISFRYPSKAIQEDLQLC